MIQVRFLPMNEAVEARSVKDTKTEWTKSWTAFAWHEYFKPVGPVPLTVLRRHPGEWYTLPLEDNHESLFSSAVLA